nr:zinc finger protein 14-like isoform X1 [Vulpes vulpes]
MPELQVHPRLPKREKCEEYDKEENYEANLRTNPTHVRTKCSERKLSRHVIEGLCKSKEVCQCGETFSQVVNHNQKKKTPTGIKLCEFSLCGQVFMHHPSFTKHMRSHTGHKPHEYQEYEGSLIKERNHIGEKPQECKECGKVFNCPNYFGCHEKTHSEEKLYECKECGKVFSSSWSCQNHERTPTRKNPPEYKECGKAFGFPRFLQNHERRHTEDKPYILISTPNIGLELTTPQSRVTHSSD